MGPYFSLRIKLELILLLCVILGCVDVKLNPLENNDKLKDIINSYVAEWQWESWPVKQELSEREGRSLGLRKNVALWGDSSKSAWYLFGGQPINGDPKKRYSDIWKFKIKTRVWKKLFPFQEEVKSAYTNKKGKTITLQPNIFTPNNASHFEPITQNVVLCGGLSYKNTTKMKHLNEWESLKRKKLDEEKVEELSGLAIYSSKASKSNTVWQIDMKEKLWTAYVCCCEISKNKKKKSSLTLLKKVTNNNKIDNETIEKSLNDDKNLTETKINYAEDDELNNEQQHLSIYDLEIKNKKVIQIKKFTEKSYLKKQNTEIIKERKKRNLVTKDSNVSEYGIVEHINDNKVIEVKEKESDKNQKNESKHSEGKFQTTKTEQTSKLMVASKYCPDFGEDNIPVAWCDGKSGAIVTADVGATQITVWVFNLTTSHWSQLQVEVIDGTEWSACQNKNSIRYVGSEEEVYMVCSMSEKQLNVYNHTSQDSRNSSKIPSESNFNTKLVFKINYTNKILRSLGKIRLNSYFNSPEGEKLWQNSTQSILRVIRNAENETILILAYLSTIDLWILNKNSESEGFDLVEKIWRGSALKWFYKYNAALYSLQFVSESGSAETILFPNPRNVGASEYWPRERGRFIIRIFRNENLQNQSFENRTRGQNLTYELLLYDYKPSGAEYQLNHLYSLKVLVFFGISLAIFTVFGVVVFLKKCVTCPSVIRIQNECHKSPLVIRYSVIPNDFLYPVG